MTQLVSAIFPSHKAASNAISELQKEGFEEISFITKDPQTGNVRTRELGDTTEGSTKGGAVIGGVLGGIVGLLAGVATVTLPGFGGLLVAGPLAALWGVSGGALGALTGGIIGGLTNVGIPHDMAERYASRIQKGDVLVAVAANPTDQDKVTRIMEKNEAEAFALSKD